MVEGLDLNKLKLIKYSRETADINLNLKILGDHNITNALGVIELGRVLNIDENRIIESIESFVGIGRRMEEIGKNVFDDYAHHPTAIKTTLNGLRNKYPEARIWAIIEPHGFKRTKALLSFYEGAFDSVDKILVGPIYKARDLVDDSVTSESIVDISKHKNIVAVDNLDEILNIIKKNQNLMIFLSLWEQGIVINGQRKLQKLLMVIVLKFNYFKNRWKNKIFFEVKDKEELIDKVNFAKINNLSIFTIGGGTDIAVSDQDFDGVVIKYVGDMLEVTDERVTAEAGNELGQTC